MITNCVQNLPPISYKENNSTLPGVYLVMRASGMTLASQSLTSSNSWALVACPSPWYICCSASLMPCCLRMPIVACAKKLGNKVSEVPCPTKTGKALLLSGTCTHRSY